MQSGIETGVKLALALVVVAAGLAVWLLPKTHLVRERRISEKLFVGTYVVGLVCGAIGLVVMFTWPGQLLEWHLWEAIVMPFAVVYAYWFVVMRRAGTGDVLDEKQNTDTANAGLLTWGLSVPAMAAASILHDKGLFNPALWYPYFLFVTLVVFSASTLYLFKRR